MQCIRNVKIEMVAYLGFDVLALFNNSGINNWDGLSDTLLAGGRSTLLVRNLLDNVTANFLRDSVANLVSYSVADLLCHSVADLFRNCVANLVRHGLANVVVLRLVLGIRDSVALAF